MKAYIKAVLLIAFTNAVHAEVNVVSDSAENGTYQAKILTKELVFDKQDRLVSRQVCNKSNSGLIMIDSIIQLP